MVFGYKEIEMLGSIFDFIQAMASNEKLTKEKFKNIRNNGSEEELEKAIAQMEQMGGYENLE